MGGLKGANMKVISLFDGLSGGQLALKKADLNVSQYHSCEIDKYAIKVTQANFPSTIQHGKVGWVLTHPTRHFGAIQNDEI